MESSTAKLSKNAFSLIELSIVVTIVAIIIVGTIQGSRLLHKSHLATAQSLTKASIVNRTEGLVTWLETSLRSSFGNLKPENGTIIDTWHDGNPTATNRNHATATSTSTSPKYQSKVFSNSLPALKFDGSNDFMNFNGTSLANSSYSIFIVEKKNVTGTGNIISTSSAGTKLTVGYNATNSFKYSHASSLNLTISNPNAALTRIHTLIFNTSLGARYWGKDGAFTNSSQTTALSDVTNSTIGSSYNGYLAEIIIFKRGLKTEERQAIETYLKEKYRIN